MTENSSEREQIAKSNDFKQTAKKIDIFIAI